MAVRKPREVTISPAGTLKISDVSGVVVYAPSDWHKATPSGSYKRLGKVRTTVFAPDGRRVIGVLVKRRDVAGMVKQDDVFCALDSIAPCDGGLRVTGGGESYDAAAQKRLGVDWDACLIWEGMDARTSNGRKLGFVGDAEFDAKTGDLKVICVGDGDLAQSLVGYVAVPVDMVLGYEAGYLVVTPEAGKLALSGGLAGVAGEGYARAKVAGKQGVEKVRAGGERAVDAASEAVEQGSRALGRQLGKTRGMFGSFMDEYKRASK